MFRASHCRRENRFGQCGVHTHNQAVGKAFYFYLVLVYSLRRGWAGGAGGGGKEVELPQLLSRWLRGRRCFRVDCCCACGATGRSRRARGRQGPGTGNPAKSARSSSKEKAPQSMEHHGLPEKPLIWLEVKK